MALPAIHAGASIVTVTLSGLELCRVAHTVTVAIEARQAFYASLAPGYKLLNAETKITFQSARHFTATDYVKVRLLSPCAAMAHTVSDSQDLGWASLVCSVARLS